MKSVLTLCLAVSTFLFAVAASSVQAQTARYTVSADGQEVSDSQNNLIWRRCVEGMKWDGSTCAGVATTFARVVAFQHAAAQAGASGKAWRVPNVKELSSIVDNSHSNPAIDPEIFPATPANWFWAARNAGDPDSAGVVVFGDIPDAHHRANSLNLRLVRTGP